MRIGPSSRVGIDLKTTWGTYPSPIFNVPKENTRVVQYLPPTIRGRHQFRTQPRSLSMLPQDPMRSGPADMMARGMSSLVPGTNVAHGVGAFSQETKTGLFIFLGAVGLVALAFAGGKR